MKTIFTNGEFVLGPYLTIQDQGDNYLADKELISKHLVEGWEQQEVADDYVHPVQAANQVAADNSKQRALRAKAYAAESDAIFFKSQRGEATHQEWLDKVAEIAVRYPYQ
jgi:hypothetical protein